MNFCGECNNLLYPIADKVNRELLLSCKICDHQEKASNNCVYRNEIKHSIEERTQISHDIASDPTLPRTKGSKCPACGGREAIFFQSMGQKSDKMTLFFIVVDYMYDYTAH
ncbi:RNA polymerase II core subunit [Heterostelium album PN500]|uniref:RNA polymerase II core subunit n=1 Tax=Heterostelium pallidum (strain ATCC 26659 / Pp 5 / PN500) TaxID=670386 RepID=D3BKZ5_HETP5|nr:RNA polymerase II core subunit [Heterostelium album PN500]EFA78575.1 RNA polymerase II core subunit [Heterostelium album PN500]|eukprot:XP_020430699.1 RNA polymerase II core subunit [Heterostelium album PN500]